ncbi:rCG55025 [Rattus norvegicus]|uniref:RCG55025 n=1 Tax=Rattus norvegicus TaxID=10116 RepID=A6IIR7_RAT|nr:rCG55025 [Rattus norvegicus]
MSLTVQSVEGILGWCELSVNSAVC